MITVLCADEGARMTIENKEMTHNEYKEDADLFMFFIGQEIKAWLGRKNIKNKDIASKVGRSRAWVDQMCRGESGSMKAARTICMAAGVELSFIVAKAEASLNLEKKLVAMRDS